MHRTRNERMGDVHVMKEKASPEKGKVILRVGVSKLLTESIGVNIFIFITQCCT